MNSSNIQIGKIYESMIYTHLTETDDTLLSKTIGFLNEKETLIVLETYVDRHWLLIKIVTMNGIIGWFVRPKRNLDLVLKEMDM